MHARLRVPRWWLGLGLTVSMLIAVGCGSDSAGPDPDDGDGDGDGDPSACPALSLGVSSAQPLTHVSLGAIPFTLDDPLAAEVSAQGVAETALTFVERAEDGSATMVAPMHPSGSAEGGAVTITVTDGAHACQPLGFQVEPLPAAPGELGEVVDLLQELVAIQAELTGTTVEELRQSDGTNLPPYLMPLAAVQSAIDHVDNPNSLRAIADGTAPLVTGVDTDFLDRMLARTGVRDGLEATLIQAGALQAHDGALSAGQIIDVDDALPCFTDPIEQPDQLNTCMSLANSAAFQMNGLTNEVLTDMNLAFGVAGTVPHPVVRLASAAGGLATWVIQKYKEGMANLLPSEFTALNVQATPAEFLEDEEGSGHWTAEVMAKSEGWRLDQVALEALLQIAGASSAYSAWLERFIPPSAISAIGDLIQTVVVGQIIQESGGTDFIEIEPKTFGPIDVSNPTYSERSVFGDAFEFTGFTTYEPRKWGETLLEVRTMPGLFGFQQIDTEQPLTLRVIPISIYFQNDADRVVTEALQDFPLTLVVENSKHPEMVRIDPLQPLHGTGTMAYAGDGMHTANYKAPANLGLLPDYFVVEHTAQTGARAYTQDDKRTAIVVFKRVGLSIAPRSACLLPGQQEQFTAEVTGLGNGNVQWNASLGSIDDSGLYTPPPNAQPGTQVTITATSAEDAQISDTVTITVNCVCTFEVTVGAFGYEAVEGDVARFRTGDFAPYNGSVWTIDLYRVGDLEWPQYENWTGLMIGPEHAGEPAPIDVGAGGDFGLIDNETHFLTHMGSLPGDPPVDPALVTLVNMERTDNLLSGDAHGDVYAVRLVDETIVLRRAMYDLSFRITLPDGYVPNEVVPGVNEYTCTVQNSGGGSS